MPDTPGSMRLMEAIDVTWPPAELVAEAGWVLRRGAGGGKRVSAASPVASPAASGVGDVSVAEAAMRAWGQGALFRLIPEEDALDRALDGQGYHIVDPTVLYVAPIEAMIGEQSHLAAAYTCEFRPAMMEEIWASGGIGPGRLAIMDRAAAPKSFLMSRADDTPAGAAFVSLDKEIAMIHAIEVWTHLRRKGAARLLIEAAARFGQEHGAKWLALAVTEANEPAIALYAALGMSAVGRYHYRMHPETHAEGAHT